MLREREITCVKYVTYLLATDREGAGVLMP
jgi:hypothetical protein